MMPLNLIFIRHGESHGNVASAKARENDYSLFTESFVNTPGREWTLTQRGVEQAKAVGSWLEDERRSGFLSINSHFEDYYVSPYVRTKQTAGNFGLTLVDRTSRPSVKWRLNRSLRERDWGEIETMPRQKFYSDPIYVNSVKHLQRDPLYWRAPGGESIADVAENRIRNFLDTIHRRSYDGGNVYAVTHGECMRAAHLVLTRADDETYFQWNEESRMRYTNCEILHFTRTTPEEFSHPSRQRNLKTADGSKTIVVGPEVDYLSYVRRVIPHETDRGYNIIVGEWTPIEFSELTNEELLIQTEGE